MLCTYGISTSQFEVEVTETVLLGAGSDSVSETLRRLHESDVLTFRDDFGKTIASLTHPEQFPVDHIKMDRSFVRDIEHDGTIVAAVVGLGCSLGRRSRLKGWRPTIGPSG
ncbi:EAL domain-containing protein [Methylobacterium durans]|uniref:EAL domain-containing protein n=1 Tax=Methylobacterium durans TaxID=2202825 RepID=UPI002AFE743D|nr:EAL domain-containing protein [Methylobacterium durans]MEA1834285.1 EAL domain-containing protein [Methylobacterium durans]